MMKKISHAAGLFLSVLLLIQSASATTLLVPGGQVIGLELEDATVTVAAFDETLGRMTEAAGLKVGDKLISINHKPVQSAQDVRSALTQCEGKVEISILRNGKPKTLHVTPEVTKDGPKLGIYLKDSITGVGTVTWYNPDTGTFGALGHGVNAPSGQLVNMNRGHAYEANIVSIQKGKAGQPGQLMGAMRGDSPIGTLSKNTPQGIFGTADKGWSGEMLPVADTAEIQKGPAVIRSTIEGTTSREYSVDIVKIYPNSGASGRNLLLRITDPELLSTTGGIVQGMSGSPIIQNGKLVGAVTHVLVNDPCTGYGIFIENMLNAAA